MSLKERIQQDMKDALRAGDKARLGTIRLVLAAIKQHEVDERTELDDARILGVLDKMIKQRRESIAQFQKAGREDLIAKEQAEIDQITPYMPAALSDAEIAELIEAALTSTGASSIRDMGKVMADLKPKLQGRADMGKVSGLIKARLA